MITVQSMFDGWKGTELRPWKIRTNIPTGTPHLLPHKSALTKFVYVYFLVFTLNDSILKGNYIHVCIRLEN